MTEYLILQLGDSESDATWAAFDSDGRLASPIGRGPLAAARPAAEGRRFLVLVPAPDVLLTAVQVPAASQARIRQMLPFSLEEMLAADVDEMLFAVGPRLESGALTAAVVAQANLDRWLAELAACGLTPHAVYSEADGVPSTPATLTLLVDASRIYGRRAGRPSFVFEGLGLAAAYDLIRGEDKDAADLKHLLVYVDDAGRAIYQRDLAALQQRVESSDVKLVGDGLFTRLAATIAARPGTNLLQGAYAPKSNWAALARPWRVAAALLVAIGLLSFLSQGAEYFALRRESATLDALIAGGCERIVASPRTSACATEVQRRLREAGDAGSASGETFLSTLSAVAASRDPSSRIEQLSYRNQTMNLQLVASSVPALADFAQRLGETQRFEAVIESTNPGDDGVEGRVQVGAAGRQ